MSFRRQIHDLVAGVLNTAGMKWVDLWKAQVTIEPPSDAYPFNFPAGFISINRIAWEDMSINQKQGTVTFQVRLFFDKYADHFEGAADKEVSFQDIETLESIDENIHWLTSDAIQEITCIAEEDLTDQYNRPAYMLTYETIIWKKLNRDIYVY